VNPEPARVIDPVGTPPGTRGGALRRSGLLWGLAFAVATFVGLLFALQQMAQAAVTDESIVPRSLATQLLPWYSWALLTPLIVEALLRSQRLGPRRRVAATLLLGPALIAVHLALITWPTRALGYVPGLSLPEAWARLVVLRGPSEVISVGLIFAVVLAVRHARRARAEELERAAVARRMLEARLAALRSQLDPHFLLNTLNSISALAAAGRKEATEQAIVETGELLREALRRPDIVSVAQELEYLRLYLRIVGLGRSDAAAIRIDAAADTESCGIPSFLLQPMVENALRHGRAGKDGEPRAEVRIRRVAGTVEVTVENPVVSGSSDPVGWTTGIGLRNTRARLQALYGGAADMEIRGEDGRVKVRIRIPDRADRGTPAIRTGSGRGPDAPEEPDGWNYSD
jgi:two-component system LytT family sensor kinase